MRTAVKHAPLPAALPSLVLALLLTALMAVPAAARVTVDYVVFVGGARIGTLSLAADVAPGRYQLETRLETEEVAGATEEATLILFAAGARDETALTPHIFTSDYVNAAGQSSQIQITFNDAGPVSVLALPPPASAPAPLSDFHKKGALDPVSAVFATTLGATEDLCARAVPVFDGWRRFDLSIAYAGETEISGSEGYAGPAHKCEGRLEPVAGYTAEAVAAMREEPQSVEFWLAPAGPDRMLLPVRIIAPTPFGGAVIRSTAIRED